MTVGRKDGESATRDRMAAMLGSDTAATRGSDQGAATEVRPVGAAGGRVTPMRLSVDLAPVAYQRLAQWVLDAGADLGQKVTHVAVFRALLDELLEDGALQARVRRRLSQR